MFDNIDSLITNLVEEKYTKDFKAMREVEKEMFLEKEIFMKKS